MLYPVIPAKGEAREPDNHDRFIVAWPRPKRASCGYGFRAPAFGGPGIRGLSQRSATRLSWRTGCV